MSKEGGDGVVRTTTDARQGSSQKTNLHVLVVALAMLAIIGVALYGFFYSHTPNPSIPGTSTQTGVETKSPVQ